MGLETGTAVATIYHSSVRLGLPVPQFLDPALAPPWASQRVGSGLVVPAMWRRPTRSNFWEECYHSNGMKWALTC